jgi:hypothetical protein
VVYGVCVNQEKIWVVHPIPQQFGHAVVGHPAYIVIKSEIDGFGVAIIFVEVMNGFCRARRREVRPNCLEEFGS